MVTYIGEHGEWEWREYNGEEEPYCLPHDCWYWECMEENNG